MYKQLLRYRVFVFASKFYNNINYNIQCNIYSHLFGKMHFYTAMAVPGMISALVAPKMIHSHLRLQSITYDL